MTPNRTTNSLEEKKAALLSSGVMVSLQPSIPETLKVALSTKQNFALATEELFCHALKRTVWAYRNDYEAIEVIMNEVKNTAIEAIATDQGIERITGLVFGNSVLREFVFMLQAQFFSQFSEFHSHWSEMIGNIAGSLTNDCRITDGNPKFSLIPEEIISRLYGTDHMKDLLLANNWLIMFIFIVLWGRTTTYEELRAIQRRANNNGTGPAV